MSLFSQLLKNQHKPQTSDTVNFTAPTQEPDGAPVPGITDLHGSHTESVPTRSGTKPIHQ